MARVPSHEMRTASQARDDAERCDRPRPRYPDALIDRIAGGGPAVLDVGCGTGILARQLVAAGCRVLGVDPDPQVAGEAHREGVEVEVAAFESWSPAGRVFDTVASGSAWHWLHPVRGAVAARRALRPGGRLVVFWNAFEPQPGIGAAFDEIYQQALPGRHLTRWSTATLDSYDPLLELSETGVDRAGGFGPVEYLRFDWQRTYTTSQWITHLATVGVTSTLPPDAQAAIAAGVDAVIDGIGGWFTMRCATVAISAATI